MNKNLLKKLYIAFIINIVILLSCSCCVFASNFYSNLVNSVLNFVQDPLGKTESDIKYLVHQTFNSVGFLIDETGITLDKIKNAIHSTDNSFDTSTSDEDDVAEWIAQNISTVSGNVVYGNQYNSFIKNYSSNYNSNIRIFYSVDVNNCNITFSDVQKNFILSNQDSYYVVCDCSELSSSGTTWRDVCFSLIPFNTDLFVYPINQSGDFYECNFTTLAADGILVDTTSYGSKAFNGNCVEITNNTNVSTARLCNGGKTDNLTTISSGYSYVVSSGVVKKYIGYIPPFSTPVNTNPNYSSSYYNNSTWDNFVDNSSGDYVVNSNNVNTVTYGDTNNYINNYYTENNNYPDNSVVNTWIENTNIENNTNNDNGGGDSGGGSGSGDDDSGSIGDIFGWLKQLGSAIGSLIKGLGEFLAEVIEGLSEAITELLSAISSLLQSLTQDLPSQFFDFLGALFSWMPAEWTTLLSYSLIAMIIWGIVKMIRG